MRRYSYWIRTGLQTFAWDIAACGFYALLMYIQLSGPLSEILAFLPVYLLVFGAMVLVGMNMGVYKMNLPLALSFGSTRNEAIIGLQLFRLIPTVLLTAVLALLCSLEGADLTVGQAIPIGLGAYLAGGAIGAILGVIFTRFGKIAAVISAVAIMLVAFGGGLLAGMSAGDSPLVSISLDGGLPWAILGAGVLLYSIAMIPEQRTVWKCNVKL